MFRSFAVFAISLFGFGITSAQAEQANAVYAGGCFWCMEKDFEKLEGVSAVVSGYTGGDTTNPTYQSYDGHTEAVKVTYDPAVISYRQLTEYFFRHIDPLDSGGQFCDRGSHYFSAVFVANDEERVIAQAVKTEGEALLGKDFYTPIRDAGPFYLAEDYHQDFYKKNALRYNTYRAGCGRDARVKAVWGKHKHRAKNKNPGSEAGVFYLKADTNITTRNIR